MREPGYCVNFCTSTPISLPGSEEYPSLSAESRTARQNGALLPGWLLARSALVSSGFGNAGAVKLGGAPAAGALALWASAGPAITRAKANKRGRIRPRMAAPGVSLHAGVLVLCLRAIAH